MAITRRVCSKDLDYRQLLITVPVINRSFKGISYASNAVDHSSRRSYRSPYASRFRCGVSHPALRQRFDRDRDLASVL